ncbi:MULTISPECIES: MFS transporter [unclassified Lysobacter]|uniref:MFS transporter n=1 Tax=unclassified Lysobacter TaxID=2635362 RepID=UPI001BEB268F|nr:MULTISPECIES: MFS transporter [unclassified Lysobacter]MBT2748854.1 MFS transporter [Lysobacter sp. ISL-42]MBT2751099.1 MFS transporter [Lysobacter sp. ISL-50]MBT2779645.1 MFS transporter [Lysobacter sp. ISL-54]MBT2783415.1 MFS transporter [Lysobacter sp. ISL-52]
MATQIHAVQAVSSPRSDAPALDVQQFINERGISGVQWLTVALCFLIVFIDGYDTAAAGYIAPSLSRDWGVAAPMLKPMMSAALIGLAIGAIGVGPIADRFGRRKVLIGSLALFGVFSLASAWAYDIVSISVLRLLTGIGLGAAMPNAITLTSEYCPARHRSKLTMAMFCGFTLGSASGGFVAARLIGEYGWQSVLIVGGVAPLLLVPVLIALLPESLQYLVVRRGGAGVPALLKRMDRSARLDERIRTTVPEIGKLKTDSAVAVLFSPGYTIGTVALWATYFCGLLTIYLITSWLPTLVSNAGLPIAKASQIGGMFMFGGALGCLLMGVVMDRYDPHRAIAWAYSISAVLLLALAQSSGDLSDMGALVFAAGLFINAGQSALLALAAGFYPTQGRATGVAWMNGIGRFGGIFGAYFGGTLLGLGWNFAAIVSALAVPALLAATAIWIKGLQRAPG